MIGSGGFREAGAVGVKIEKRILTICWERGILQVGPTCLGNSNTLNKGLFYSYAAVDPKPIYPCFTP
jgi:acyl-CoA synthetase (NDP forming)